MCIGHISAKKKKGWSEADRAGLRQWRPPPPRGDQFPGTDEPGHESLHTVLIRGEPGCDERERVSYTDELVDRDRERERERERERDR